MAEWKAYVGNKELKAGDWLAFQPVASRNLVKVKFLSVDPDGQHLITGGEGEDVKSLPVFRFEGVSIKRPAGTIDLTPTWRAVLPILIETIRDGNATNRQNAKLELERMAQAADAYNASVKK